METFTSGPLLHKSMGFMVSNTMASSKEIRVTMFHCVQTHNVKCETHASNFSHAATLSGAVHTYLVLKASEIDKR